MRRTLGLVPFLSDRRQPAARAAVLIVGTRADAGRLRIAAASLARHAKWADRFVLAIDQLPGDELRCDAAPLPAAEFIAYERLLNLAYTSTPRGLAEALVPQALHVLLERGYDAAVALPATAFARAPLDPFFAALDAADVIPDPAFATGWWGARRGAARRVTRRHPSDTEIITLRDASSRALTRAAVVLVHDDLPPVNGRDVSHALLAVPDAIAELASAYRRTSLDVGGGARGPAYRYAAFSNGVAFDDACRALLRDALAAGERFDDPGDVRAAPGFFAWLISPSAPGLRLNRYLERYVALRPALRRAFPGCGAKPAELVSHLRAQRPDDLDPAWYDSDALIPAALRDAVPESAGVNVIGYFRAELGIGEAGRSLARAVRIAGVPHALIDFSSGSSNRSGDRTIERFEDGPRYDISVLCANPDQFSVFDLHPSSAAFGGGRYRVGAWWFELPDLPPDWLGGLARVDEIWAGSHFVEAAMARVAPVPVTYVPPIVEPRPNARVSRAEFGLADDELAYLFVFDFNSVWERKNPDGAVAAFRRAFETGVGARLILKTINSHLHPAAYQRLRDIVGDDPRITLIDEYYDADRLARLMRACDAYVSLHRAEGFGLTIAEAMLYGKPAVATRWSGNLDFMTPQNSFLIDGKLTRIDRAAGPYYAGGLWAEPDLDAAAAAMRLIADHPRAAADRAALGRLDVRSLFSAARVASLVRARIDAIGAKRKVCA